MSGHTPGPWEYSIADGIYQQRSGYRLAGLSYAGKAISQRISYEELEANARLIAAAPELLDALIRVVPYLETVADEDKGYKPGSVARLVRELRQTITKAEGTPEPVTK